MEILRLLDELEDMADSGEKWYCRFPPFIGKTVVDAADLFDLIHQMRQSLPHEMTEASALARDRDRILEEAHEQRAKIIEAAREQAQLMTSNDELVKQAEARSDQILDEAEVLENYTDRIQATVQKTKKMLLAQQGGRELEEPGAPLEQ